jgi:hypothetical protein
MTTEALVNTRKGDGAANPYSVFDLSIKEAMNKKRMEGINEYRGGDESLPFEGDPIPEMYCEFIDALNYNEEAKAKGFKLYDKFKKVLNELAQELKQYQEEK